MEDFSNAQDATLNNVEETQTKNSGRKDFWKGLLRTVLGISISITLTFGTNALLIRLRALRDRKMTAMMVMGNIETFADHLDQCANHMGWNDTLATYLLAIPEDSIDLVDINDLLFCVNNVTAFYTLNHDKSAENIFSNSVDTWKNIGNFDFIENIGQCFADINSIETIYETFINTSNHIRERIVKNPDAYQGNSVVSKALHDKEYRNHLTQIHSQKEYYHYLAAYLRWKNAKNLKLMNVTKEALRAFIEKTGQKQKNTEPAPEQETFRSPRINPDGLPEMKQWLK